MTLFVLYQTDVWKSKASRVFCGIFDTREKAIDNAKYNGLHTHYSEVVVLEVSSIYLRKSEQKNISFGLGFHRIKLTN